MEEKKNEVIIDTNNSQIINELVDIAKPTYSMFFNVNSLNIFLGSAFINASNKGSICNIIAYSSSTHEPSYVATTPHLLKGFVSKGITEECSLLYALYQMNEMSEEVAKSINKLNIFTSSVPLFKSYRKIVSTVMVNKTNPNFINTMLEDKRMTIRKKRIIKATAEMNQFVKLFYVDKRNGCAEESFNTVFNDVNGIKLNFWDSTSIALGIMMSSNVTKRFAFTDKTGF